MSSCAMTTLGALRLMLIVVLLSLLLRPLGAAPLRLSPRKTIQADDWGRAPFALSPDGQMLATRLPQGFALRDTKTYQPGMRFDGPGAGFYAKAAFGPDGSVLALSSDFSFAFSPDGKTIASAGSFPHLYDISTGQERQFQTASLPGLAATGQAGYLTLWDAVTRAPVWSAEASPVSGGETADTLAFSPDGQWLATGNGNGGLKFWDAKTGLLLRTLTGPPSKKGSMAARAGGILAHPGRVVAVRFSPDGRALVSAGGDGSVRVWDPAIGALLRTIESYGGVQAFVFAPDGTLYAAFRRDIVHLQIANGRILTRLRGHDEDVQSLTLTPDGKTLWSGADDGTIKRWDLAQGVETATYGAIAQAAVTPDGKTLAFSRGDSTITLQDIRTGRVLRTLHGFFRPQRSGMFSYVRKTLAFSPDGRTLAGGAYTTEGFVDHSGVFHSRVLLWDVRSGHMTKDWQEDPAARLTFNPDSRQLVELTPDLSDTPSVVRVRALPSGMRLRDWQPNGLYGQNTLGLQLDGAGLCFCRNGVIWLATSGRAPNRTSGISGIWDVRREKLVRALQGEMVYSACYAFSQNGRIVAGADQSGVHLWNAATGQLKTQSAKNARGSSATDLRFSTNGHFLATAATENQQDSLLLQLRDGHSGKVLAQTEASKGRSLILLSFSRDAKRLYALEDHTVHVWEVERQALDRD